MKRTDKIKVLAGLFILACLGCQQPKESNNELILVDVTQTYPSKELILQDFMDVEYVPLESADDFLTQGNILAIGEEYILVENWIDDGNIFIFDRKGKGVRIINRKGNSGQEYNYIYNAILDEENSEILVNDSYQNKILVYDLYGNYKRSFAYIENAKYNDIINYDKESFAWRNSAFQYNDTAVEMPSFFICSKQDGSIVTEIELPFEKRVSPVFIWKDPAKNMTYGLSPTYYAINQFQDRLFLVESSSDTIYTYSQAGGLNPLFVRTPSVHTMNPEVFLFLSALTDRYYFIFTSQKDREMRETDLVYDRQTKEIFRCTVFNGDYSNKKYVYTRTRKDNKNIAFWQVLDAENLIESYNKGQLKGTLKEIAATLDEESNPVIMLAKHKV